MKIGIVGAGNIGSALARHFRERQHTVLIANSRSPETLSALAHATGAMPVALSDMARGVDLLIIAIPMKSVPLLPKEFLDGLPATSPILDTGNYYPLRDGRIAAIDKGMIESEWVASLLGRPVLKVFNNIVADSLLRKGLPRGSKHRIALPISGDDATAKRRVIALIDEIGFDALDAGPLAESWRQQPGTPAYCPDPTLSQLPGLLQRAQRDKSPANRDRAAQLMAKLPADFPPQNLVRLSRLSAGMDLWKPQSWRAVLSLGFALLRS
ncbi:NADPH-dependent F420 reductase [Silvibacterium sp.]|uniref:NADPH-dependent F420 reductase n=1 Tax=Silvibacterium sp. TaxID=1964179 RepID=UPI0039E53E38